MVFAAFFSSSSNSAGFALSHVCIISKQSKLLGHVLSTDLVDGALLVNGGRRGITVTMTGSGAGTAGRACWGGRAAGPTR